MVAVRRHLVVVAVALALLSVPAMVAAGSIQQDGRHSVTQLASVAAQDVGLAPATFGSDGGRTSGNRRGNGGWAMLLASATLAVVARWDRIHLGDEQIARSHRRDGTSVRGPPPLLLV